MYELYLMIQQSVHIMEIGHDRTDPSERSSFLTVGTHSNAGYNNQRTDLGASEPPPVVVRDNKLKKYTRLARNAFYSISAFV